jgi:aminomethyltransferase
MSLLHTPLHAVHARSGARLVDFGGWEMPLHYGSQLDEHKAVRADAGVFDVSHMCAVDVAGADALAFLRHLLANDCERLTPGKALYSCMLHADGGIIDDLIVYRLTGLPDLPAGSPAYRIIVNAGTATSDLDWMHEVVERGRFDVALKARRDLALVAVQGPRAREAIAQVRPALGAVVRELGVFSARPIGDWFVARTGYTGEDGCEIAMPVDEATDFWTALVQAGVRACGLGARDTLRLEAGMNLYGSDMDRTVTPFESGLAWTVDLRAARAFIGRAALERQAAKGGHAQLLGLRLLDAGVLRSHQTVRTAHGEGITTSGSFAPTMNASIALARVPAGVQLGDIVDVDLRGRAARALVCRPPFVRQGKVLVTAG